MEEKNNKASLPEDVSEQQTAKNEGYLSKDKKMKKRFFLQLNNNPSSYQRSVRSSVIGDEEMIRKLGKCGENTRFLRTPEYIARFYGEDSEQYRRAVEKQDDD